MPTGYTNAGSGSGGSTSLDDIDVLVADFLSFANVTITEGYKDESGRQVYA